jgi:FtsP/CotA-like multicopper oxidase with cupredoxin domain
MDRRSFLKVGGAGLASSMMGTGLLSWVPRSEAATISKTYYINDGTVAMPDGVSVYFQSFGDSATTLALPATPIICQEGDTLSITVINRLLKTHNFVIGGLKTGDAPLASTGNIASGATGTINFTVPVGAAGSYMFYDNVTSYNRFIGLHGGLAIMPSGSTTTLYANSPTFKYQKFWVLNDIDPAINNAVQLNGTIPTSYRPRYFTINGLSSRPPGATDAGNPAIDAMSDPRSKLSGSIGDRTLLRIINAGMCSHSVHVHANHMEWLTDRGTVRPSVWKKDVLYIRNNFGKVDSIYPFTPPPDAYPAVTTGHFPMHLHDEMSQTAGGGLYQFGSMTEIEFL